MIDRKSFPLYSLCAPTLKNAALMLRVRNNNNNTKVRLIETIFGKSLVNVNR